MLMHALLLCYARYACALVFNVFAPFYASDSDIFKTNFTEVIMR